MSCQFGIYPDRDFGIDDWDALIYQDYDESPRTLLETLTPFLRTFHTIQDMTETGNLAADLVWCLVEVSPHSTMGPGFSRIEISREIRSGIDFFYKISPGFVDVYRVDEVLEWKRIATAEISQEVAALI